MLICFLVHSGPRAKTILTRPTRLPNVVRCSVMTKWQGRSTTAVRRNGTRGLAWTGTIGYSALKLKARIQSINQYSECDWLVGRYVPLKINTKSINGGHGCSANSKLTVVGIIFQPSY